jgi:type II secretory pathway pseudopilin PulG
MLKIKGFTIIELLVIITVVGILATITAPSFFKSRREQKFIENAQIFFDLISEARTNAFSGKKCSNNTDGKDNNLVGNWGVWINTVSNEIGDTTKGSEFRLFCVENTSTIEADLDGISEGENHYFLPGTTINAKYKDDETSDWTNAGIQGFTKGGIIFLAGSSQARIVEFSTPTDIDALKNKGRYLKIQVEYTEGKRYQTVCLDRIAGFPTISDNANCANDNY